MNKNKNVKNFFHEWTEEMNSIELSPKKIEKPQFKCRICGSTEYEGVYGNRSLLPLGRKMYPITYQCSGCTVVFTDISKFSVHKV